MLDFLFISLLILLITHWVKMKPFFWKNADIPYSIPLPILGSTGSTLYKSTHQFGTDLYNKVGDDEVYGLHFFGYPALMLRDPNMVKKFTVVDADSFMGQGIHAEQSYDPFANGIVHMKGEQWRDTRNKITPHFTPAKIKKMFPLLQNSVENLARYVATTGKKGPLDIHSASVKFGIDVTMSTIFGIETDSFNNPDSFFFNVQKELISFILGLKLMIGILSPNLFRFLRLTLFSGKTNRKLMGLVKQVIDQRLDGIGKRPDFMEAMIDLMQKEDLNSINDTEYYPDGTTVSKFNLFTVTGHCMLMYLGGTETTGNTLAFLLYELALHQDIQDKARDEINSMMKGTNNDYGYDDLYDLEYVHMVLKETLRKYPIVSIITRECTKSIEFNGIILPVGTRVIFSPHAIQRDPRYFPEPDKFIPERFSKNSSITPGTYIPFGMGPRTCIGIKLAETEIVLALCALLPKCRILQSNRTKIPLEFNNNPTLNPKNGIWLNVEKI